MRKHTNNLMARLFIAAFSLLLLRVEAGAALPEWVATRGAPIANAPDIEHSTWSTSRTPGGPFDKIEVHRYRTKAATLATMLYLPGTNMNGEIALTDEDHNLWIFLARRGVDVFTLDYRTRFSSASTDALALSSMKTWTTEAFALDVSAAGALARAESERAQIHVAGFSRGVFLAYAYACSEPAAVAGLIALDGQFKSHAPKAQYDSEADLKKLEESQAWASDVRLTAISFKG